MTKRVIQLICALGLAIGALGTAAAPASASETVSCAEGSHSDGVYTYGDTGQQRWGWATTVHSGGCNHWGNVALHAKLPSGYQANVTLTRYFIGAVIDHRYCKVSAGGTNCHTPAILTTDCRYSYSTDVDIYIWNGSTWALVAWNRQSHMTVGC